MLLSSANMLRNLPLPMLKPHVKAAYTQNRHMIRDVVALFADC